MDWVFRYPFTSAFPTKQALEWFYSLVSKCEFHDLRYSVNFFLLYNLFTHFGRRCFAADTFRFPSLYVTESKLNFSQEEKT